MDYWLFLGFMLAGCGVGAALTTAVYLAQLKRVRAELQTDSGSVHGRSQIPDPKDQEPERRSA